MTSKQEQFIQDLVQFYRNKGINNANSSQFIARLNGKVVNLSELYSYVLERGGSYKVNQANLWDEIYFKLFKNTNIGANFAVALRQVYNRYLLQYEKSCSGNFASEQWNEDEDDENLFSNANHHSNSSSTNSQHYNNVADSAGQVHNDTKLYCSLLSGLPNELNFAFNVATILSNCNRFDWKNDYKFINVLLESMKSYCCICDQFDEDVSFGRTIFTDEDEVCMLESLFSSSIKTENSSKENGVINETTESITKENLVAPNRSKEIEYIDRKCNCYKQFWYQVCSNEEILHHVFEDEFFAEIDFSLPYSFKELPLHLMKKVEQRIELVGGIIRNISFTYDQTNTNNVSMIPLIKFLVLLLHSANINYLNISLDILSNIAPALSFSSSKPYQDTYYHLLDLLLKNIVNISLTSNNIYNTTKSFEIMSRYISCTNNEANLLLESHFDNKSLYERITQLLTCQYDITLLLALLEFCLTLSENRPFILVNNDNKTLIKILVSLLNCESSQYFTTGALKKIKIIDDRPRQEVFQSEDKTLSTVNQHTQNGPARTLVVGQPMPNHTTTPQNILDNESFAINWLRATYEDGPLNYSLKINEIYAEYVKFCCRNTRRNVIAAQSFNFLLKKCFPSCNINQANVDGLVLKGHLSNNHSDNSLVKQVTTIGQCVNASPQLKMMSPILKAHLSTPPKNNSVPISNAQVVNDISHSQSQTVTTNTSTLIKSLLANKLRNNQQVMNNQGSPIVSKPVLTQVCTQPLANSNVTQAVMIQNESSKQDSNAQKNIIFANNPTTSFAITPTFNLSNNLIVSNASTPQPPQQLQGSQQILLVRTIITGPGQQNSNTPVRLLVPASMITQQRFPAPCVTPTVNGLVANNGTTNVVPTVSQPTPLLQTQLAIPKNSAVQNNLPVSIAVSSISTPMPSTPMRNSIANSSPLLNVLLDKGKLPDFTSVSQPVSNSTSNPIMANNANPSVSNNPTQIQQGQQHKMYILTTTPTKQVSANETCQTVNISTNQTFVTSSTTDSKGAPVLITNPIVNGDLKTAISVPPANQQPVNNSLIKHVLENSNSSEICKRLKTGQNQEVANNPPIKQNISEERVVISNPTQANQKLITNNGVNASATSIPVDATDQNKPVDKQISQGIVTNSAVEVNSSTDKPNANVPKVEPIAEYECQWNNCQMKFVKPSEVFYHVHSYHIMTPSCPSIMSCQWGGPEGKGPGCLSKRPKLSLLTHLQDFHCNHNVLKQELLRKKQLSIMGTTNIMLPQPPAHPGYAQNAAMLAIRRHATNYVVSEKPPPITALSPLTVSIRLTSALILRNLAKRSQFIKKSLELFESQLCEISIAEGRDESRTVAQCLAVLNERK